MTSLLTNLFNFIKLKPRLVIEYIMIAMLITLCSIVGYLWLQTQLMKSSIEVAQTNLNNYAEKTLKLTHAVNYLSEQRDKDFKMYSELMGKLKSATNKDAVLQESLNNLETKNETVKDYLQSVIPSDLRILLNQHAPTAPRNTGDKSKPTEISNDPLRQGTTTNF